MFDRIKSLAASTGFAALAALAPLTAGAQQFPAPTDEAALYARARQEGTLVWYTGAPAAPIQNIANEFMKRYPGVKVEIIRLANVQQFQRFAQETASKQNIADLVSLDPDAMKELVAKNYIADWKVPAADKLAPAARLDNKAYAPFYIVTSILYNVNKVKPQEVALLADKWENLLNPDFKGRFAVTSQKCSVCYSMIHMFMDPALSKRFGPEFLKALAAQRPSIYPEINIALDRVVAGEKDFIVTIFENAAAAKLEEGAPVRWVHPSPTPLALTSAWSGISASAPHPHAARLFQNWWIGPEGTAAMQKYYGGLTTFTNIADTRAFVKEAWYDRITEPYTVDPVRWEANFSKDMDLWISTLRSAR